MSRRLRKILIAVLAIATITTVLWLSVGRDRVYQTGPVCEEDMSCWNCSTMGNKVCGN